MSNNKCEIISTNNLSDDDLILLSTGQGFLETLKYAQNTLWFKELHLKRLQEAAKLFKTDINISELNNSIEAEIEQNGKDNSYRIRVILLTSFLENVKKEPKILIQLLPLEENLKPVENFSLSLQPSPFNNNPLTKFKTINFGPAFFKKNEVLSSGFDDVLFYDHNNNLLEASTSNIFGVKDGKLYTPPLSQPILPGIIRQVLCNYMDVFEKEISINKIQDFDYFFLTNSIIEIQPVSKIDDIHLNFFEKGFNHLITKWDKIKKNKNYHIIL